MEGQCSPISITRSTLEVPDFTWRRLILAFPGSESTFAGLIQQIVTVGAWNTKPLFFFLAQEGSCPSWTVKRFSLSDGPPWAVQLSAVVSLVVVVTIASLGLGQYGSRCWLAFLDLSAGIYA